MSKDDVKVVKEYRNSLDSFLQYIPTWVKVATALALGLGTMVGWKRIVVTVGELSKMTHFDYLHLAFTGDIVIPEWMDKITIGRFIVEGKITDQEKENLIKRFPNIEIRNTLK